MTPRAEILCRAYSGAERQLVANLLPTTRIFLDRRRFRFTLVLDDESPADHVLGESLLREGHVDRVFYEPLPEGWQELFKGQAFPPPYNRWGFNRALWSTFYMDQYSDADIIGVLDSDATFFSYLTPENILDADGRLRLHVVAPTLDAPQPLLRWSATELGTGSGYCNDKLALGEPAPYDAMATDRNPVWFWRETYSGVRSHVARCWGTSFDNAFAQFSSRRYCQFNILANYALTYEPDRYRAVLQTDPSADIVSVCQNGCFRREDIAIGAIRSFNLSPKALGPFGRLATRAARRETTNLNRYGPMVGNACALRFAEAHYRRVEREISLIPATERRAREEAAVWFIRHGIHQVVSPNRAPFWLLLQAGGRTLTAVRYVLLEIVRAIERRLSG